MKPLVPFAILGCLATVGCAGSTPVLPDPVPSPTATTALPSAQPAPTRYSSIVQIPLFIQDAHGSLPMAADTLLFESRKHNPILAPDGHQVTLGEFNAADGIAAVQCTTQGTHVTLQLSHLIPNGVYTIWNVVFKAPGFDPTFANVIGLGALGSPAGVQNVFRASAAGDGTVSATTPAGALSAAGSIGACAITDEFEWHVVGAYDLDGQSHGPTLGPDGSAVEQFGFIFKN